DRSLASIDAALHSGADPLECSYEQWMCFMLKGDFVSAWEVTDRTECARRARPELDTRELPRHLRRIWNGDAVTGKRVLVRCYHGLGDTIQFVRYLPLLRKCSSTIL